MISCQPFVDFHTKCLVFQVAPQQILHHDTPLPSAHGLIQRQGTSRSAVSSSGGSQRNWGELFPNLSYFWFIQKPATFGGKKYLMNRNLAVSSVINTKLWEICPTKANINLCCSGKAFATSVAQPECSSVPFWASLKQILGMHLWVFDETTIEKTTFFQFAKHQLHLSCKSLDSG